MIKRFAFAAVMALSVSSALAGAPVAVHAEGAPAGTPTPYPIPNLPGGINVNGTLRTIIDAIGPLAAGAITHATNSNVGTVSYYKGFEMQIQSGPNRYTNVHLKHGTTIDPRGETIRIGDTVDVGGVKQSDGSLDANAITIRH